MSVVLFRSDFFGFIVLFEDSDFGVGAGLFFVVGVGGLMVGFCVLVVGGGFW